MKVFVGFFDREEAVLAATRAARAAGHAVHDVYTPYPVHGMDDALGLAPSRLTFVCFGAGVLGLACALGLQYYTSAVSWPLNVGGKPPNSMPAFIPVAFELTVLFAGLITTAALFLRARLWPRLRASGLPGVSRDRFALALAPGEHFAEDEAAALFARQGAVNLSWEEVP